MENQNVQNDEIEIDLRELVMVLWSRIILIVGIGLLCAVAAGVVTKLCITPLYQSTTKMYVLSKQDEAASSMLTSLTDLQLGSQVLIDYEAMMLCDEVMTRVIDDLDLDMKKEELRATIATANPANTRSLEITVTNPDPYIAKEIADTVAEESAEYCSEIMDITHPRVYQKAEAAEQKSSPNTKKNVAIAFILGAFIVCAVVIVRYLLDDTIKSSEDVEKYLGLNTLGLIPIEEGPIVQMKKDKKKRKKEMK